LDVDEHRAAVRRHRRPGDLAISRAGEKAADLAGAAVTGKHLVVADVPEFALVHLRSVGVGLDPQYTTRIYHQPVRAGEDVALDIAPGLGTLVGRVAGQHEVAPAERKPVE